MALLTSKSATEAYHKGRGIMFGGVHDVEESEEGIESEFFNELFAWNIERNRFFPLALRRPKSTPKKQGDERGKRGRGRADEAELLRNLVLLETRGSIPSLDDLSMVVHEEVVEAPAKEEKAFLDVMPHPRFNAQLTVHGDVLFIFGGTYEQGDREYTFDEMHCIDLGKLDGCKTIYKKELENWLGNHAESESDSDDDENEDESEDEDSESGVLVNPPEMSAKAESLGHDDMLNEHDDAQMDDTFHDTRPHPRAFENLRDFFTRTSNMWQELALGTLHEGERDGYRPIKELRKIAFDMAEMQWWDCREEINAEEERQEEAGSWTLKSQVLVLE